MNKSEIAEDFAKILSPAIDCRAPYAKVMIEKLVERAIAESQAPGPREIVSKLIRIAAGIARREYLPSLESCRTIADARAEVARFDSVHLNLSEKVKQVADELQGDGEPIPPRSDKDYAIEHGGYLADAVMQYLTAHNRFDEKEATTGSDEADADLLNDCRRALIKAVGEFRKRAKRASGAAQEVSPPSPEPEMLAEICIDCGHEFGVWFAENPVWNEIIPGRIGMLCPCCFIVRAEKRGFHTTGWKMVPMDNPLGEKSVEQLGDTRELKAALKDSTLRLEQLIRYTDLHPDVAQTYRNRISKNKRLLG